MKRDDFFHKLWSDACLASGATAAGTSQPIRRARPIRTSQVWRAAARVEQEPAAVWTSGLQGWGFSYGQNSQFMVQVRAGTDAGRYAEQPV